LDTATTTWRPVVTGALAGRVLEFATLVSDRVSDPDVLAATAERERRQSRFPDTVGGTGASLGSGHAGLALLDLYLARSAADEAVRARRLAAADRHLRAAASSTRTVPLAMPGMSGGSSGFALVLAEACRAEPRYQTTLDRLHVQLAEQVRAAPWRRAGTGVSASDYDAISGAAGVLGYLVSIPRPDDAVRAAIEHLLGYLGWLGGTPDEPGGLPRWFLSPALYPIEDYREQFPYGYLNPGLSHGVPGPLAALALAWVAGYRVPGHRDALARMAGWLMNVQVLDDAGPNWAVGVPVTAQGREQREGLPVARTAWCYGAPGVAAALWLAGQALDDPGLRTTAVDAIEAVTRRLAIDPLPSPTLCHGNAGILAICLRFAHEAGSTVAAEHSRVLVQQILARCDPGLTYGVQDEETQQRRVDQPGVLVGAAGVALALLAATTGVRPDWLRALMIA
jgi:lantibiotic biosynthesis protein